MKLKIPQLILDRIAQMVRHETVNTISEHYGTRVEGSVPVRGNFFAEFILLLYNSGQMTYLGKHLLSQFKCYR